jgi:inward rectifier potassium channel
MTSPRLLEDDPLPDPTEEDLGFGKVAAQRIRGRFLGRDGRPTSVKYGMGAQYIERAYLHALGLTWGSFLAWTIGMLFLLNGFFALAYSALGPTAVTGGEALGLSDPFMRALVFSVGVFTTSGVGAMHAVGSTANWLFLVESFVGPLVLLTVAGLLIARLTRPRTRIAFSESMVVGPYEGGRGVMFRMVNLRLSELTDVQVRLAVSMFVTVNGERYRDFFRLPLEREVVEFFTLHWTIVHPITAESPLRGMTPAKLAEAEAEFLILVSAHEETFSTRVMARTSYLHDEVAWDAKFDSIFVNAAEGSIAIDVERLSMLERLPEGSTAEPAALEGPALAQS